MELFPLRKPLALLRVGNYIMIWNPTPEVGRWERCWSGFQHLTQSPRINRGWSCYLEDEDGLQRLVYTSTLPSGRVMMRYRSRRRLSSGEILSGLTIALTEFSGLTLLTVCVIGSGSLLPRLALSGFSVGLIILSCTWVLQLLNRN